MTLKDLMNGMGNDAKANPLVAPKSTSTRAQTAQVMMSLDELTEFDEKERQLAVCCNDSKNIKRGKQHAEHFEYTHSIDGILILTTLLLFM